jgi:hypothetical protein
MPLSLSSLIRLASIGALNRQAPSYVLAYGYAVADSVMKSLAEKEVECLPTSGVVSSTSPDFL